MTPLLITTLLHSLASAPEPSARVETAVLVSGDDARAAGRLQRDLERTLATEEGITVVPARRIAAVLPREVDSGAASAEEGRAATAEGAIRSASDAFYDGDMDECLRRIESAERALSEVRTSGHDARIRALLWKAAALAAAGRKEEAAVAARRVLVLDPRLRVDLSTFWPSLAELVDSQRGEVVTIPVRVAQIPSNAQVWVDGRGWEPSSTVGAGPHLIAVTAPGYRSVIASVEVDAAGGEVALPIPLALPASLITAVRAGEGGARATLGALCGKIGAGSCAFVDTSGATYRVVVVNVNARGDAPPAIRSFPRGEAIEAMSAWIAERARPTQQAETAARGRPTSHTGRLEQATPSSAIEVRGRLMLAMESATELRWGDSVATLAQSGGGVGVAAAWASRERGHAWLGDVELSVKRWMENRISGEGVNTSLPARAGSSWKLGSIVRAGYRFPWSAIRTAAVPFVAVRLAVQTESSVSTSDVQLFPAFSWSALAFGLALDLRPTESTRVRASAGLDVFGFYLKSPSGLGTVGAPAGSPMELVFIWNAGKRWGVGLGVYAQILNTGFGGNGTVAVDPAVVNADLSHADIGLTFELVRRM